MRNFRERYGRYALFVLIFGLGATIFIELTPFLGGLMGAATLYVLLRGQMVFLTERRRWRPSAAAALLLVEAVLCFLVPLTLVGWMLVVHVQHLAADPQQLLHAVKNLSALLYERTGYDLWQERNMASLIAMLPRVGQYVLGGIVDFAVNIVVLLLVLYFMLTGGRAMEAYVRDLIPFDGGQRDDVIHEMHQIVRSNAIGIPLLAVVQGGVALVGYLIFGVPDPLFWGVLTCFATVIPIVGTALLWLPLAAYLALEGHWAAAVGLAAYGTLVVTHVDNLTRLVLQRRVADIHPLVTVFGVFVGLALFGFMGIIFGPLMLSLFLFCLHIFKRRYIDGRPDESADPAPTARH